MQVLYVFMIISGGVVLCMGIPKTLKFFKLKTIGEFFFEDKVYKLKFLPKGNYAVAFEAGFNISSSGDFKIKIWNQETNELINYRAYSFGPRSFYGRNLAIEYAYFEIKSEATYNIEFFNLEDLKSIDFPIIPFGLFRKNKSPRIFIIKKAIPRWTLLLSILYTQVGIALFLIGSLSLTMSLI